MLCARPGFPARSSTLSFFDDDGDDPPTRTARARPRPRGASSAGAPRGGTSANDQIVIRRAVFIGLLVVVALLLIFGVKACRDSSRKNSLRDYNSSVSTLARESDSQVGRPFFALLNGARGKSPVTVETQVNQYRVLAEEQATRAGKLSVPGSAVPAQRNLVLALNFRAEALRKVADRVRSALGARDADVAIGQIAGQMEVLLASDVVYSQRVAPLIKQALDSNGVTGQQIVTSRFVRDLGWLDPGTLGDRLGVPGGGSTSSGAIAPGTHGHGLVSTVVGGVTLQPGGTANRITASTNPTFTVSFQNQGSNDERGVTVQLKITGAGKPITVRKTVDQTKAGATVALPIPLGQSPPVGTPVTVSVSVLPVPGEKKTDNNSSTYTAFFTR
jgi:hypothetical protein